MVSVTFEYVDGLWEDKIRKKKTTCPLYLLLLMLCCVLWEELCGRRRRVSSSSFFFYHVAGEGCDGVAGYVTSFISSIMLLTSMALVPVAIWETVGVASYPSVSIVWPL